MDEYKNYGHPNWQENEVAKIKIAKNKFRVEKLYMQSTISFATTPPSAQLCFIASYEVVA